MLQEQLTLTQKIYDIYDNLPHQWSRKLSKIVGLRTVAHQLTNVHNFQQCQLTVKWTVWKNVYKTTRWSERCSSMRDNELVRCHTVWCRRFQQQNEHSHFSGPIIALSHKSCYHYSHWPLTLYRTYTAETDASDKYTMRVTSNLMDNIVYNKN